MADTERDASPGRASFDDAAHLGGAALAEPDDLAAALRSAYDEAEPLEGDAESSAAIEALEEEQRRRRVLILKGAIAVPLAVLVAVGRRLRRGRQRRPRPSGRPGQQRRRPSPNHRTPAARAAHASRTQPHPADRQRPAHAPAPAPGHWRGPGRHLGHPQSHPAGEARPSRRRRSAADRRRPSASPPPRAVSSCRRSLNARPFGADRHAPGEIHRRTARHGHRPRQHPRGLARRR